VTERTAILAIVGASGAGKTRVVEELAQRDLPGVTLHHFDSIGVPSVEEMERGFGSGEAWQAATTDQWISRLAAIQGDAEVAILEGQTRPSFLRDAFVRHAIGRTSIVLLDCAADIRWERLHGMRNQPELANARMDSWSAYLRGQADALGLPVLDTGTAVPAAIADALVIEIDRLRSIA
jgi:signal recognition particle receptor subunit beta